MSAEAQACDRCHRRKTRCDKRRPECTPCIKANVSCAYSTRAKEPLYRRDVVEKLEKRARQLEINNRALQEQLAAATRPAGYPEAQNIEHEHVDDGNATVLRPAYTSAAHVNVGGTPIDRHDVTSEVSFLSTYAGGDRQFLGSASGLFLANLVRGTVREHAGVAASSFTSPDDGQLTRGNWSIDKDSLPPRQLTNKLVDAYLAHDALCYPIVHSQDLFSIVDALYADRAQSNTNPWHAFMFHMVLAIATAQIHKFHWQILPDAETHHARAMVHLDSVLSRGGIEALQAMLLCCQFRLGSSTKDSSGSLWHLVGIAIRMCLELGLHRESSYSQAYNSPVGDETSITIYGTQEVRRTCFWCAFCLDRVVSTTLGRPLALQSEDVDTALPSVRDVEATATPVGPINSPGTSSLASSYRKSIFVHIARYRTLCGTILTSVHRGSRLQAPAKEVLHHTRASLEAELDSWHEDTAILGLPDMDLATPLAEARSSFLSKAWYELLYQNGILLLYRPSPSSPEMTTGEDRGSLQKIYSAAKQSVTLYAYLFKCRKINFSWITLHAVFLAGISYIYAVSAHLRELRKQRSNGPPASILLSPSPTIVEIVNDTRACSNVLVAVSERCNAPKNCHEVFDRLSDAALTDAIELSTQTPSILRPSTPAMSYEVSACNPEKEVIDDNAQHMLPRALPQGFNTSTPLAVDNALRDSLPDLQDIYHTSWADDAIFQLSMDWLEGIGPPTNVHDTSL